MFNLEHLSHPQNRQGGLRVSSQDFRIILPFSQSSCSGLRAIMLLLIISWKTWMGICRIRTQSCSLLISAAAGKPVTLWHKSRRTSTSGRVSWRAIRRYTNQWEDITFSEACLHAVWTFGSHISSCVPFFILDTQCLEMIILIIGFAWRMGLCSYNDLPIFVESESRSVVSDSIEPMDFSRPEYWSG